MVEKLWFTKHEVCKQLSLGMSSVERLIAQEGLPVVRVGTAVRIPADELRRWLNERYGVVEKTSVGHD